MEPERSFPHSHLFLSWASSIQSIPHPILSQLDPVHTPTSYPKPARSSPYPHILSWISSIQSIPPHPILNQLDTVHTPTSYFLKINLNIILPYVPGSPKRSLSLKFPHQNPVYASPLPHTRYMPRPSHFFSILSPEQYWVRSTDHSVPHYAASSTSLLSRPSQAQINYSAPISTLYLLNNYVRLFGVMLKI